MQTLHATDVKVGDTIEFYYYGGTQHGALRRVKVEQVDLDLLLVKGTDLNKDAPRCYNFGKMSTCKLIERPTITTPMTETATQRLTMDFFEAREKLHAQVDAMTGEDLAEVLAEVEGADKGEFVVDSDTGRNYVALEVQKEVPVAHFRMNETDDTIDIQVVNDRGEIAVMNGVVSDNGFVMLLDNEVVTPDEFAQKLSAHLS